MQAWRPSPERPGHLNVGCGPHRAKAPWWNTDVVDDQASGTHPDEVVAPWHTYGPRSCLNIYLGHVLEHVEWVDVQPFLTMMMDQLVPDGELAVVGPDVLRIIEMWHVGEVGWDLVLSGLEDFTAQDDLGNWDEARHKWNCHEDRVIRALETAGFVDVRAVPLDALARDWPVVGQASWQCSVVGRKPS